jgi:glucose/arabinose dehydrogenase
MRNTALILAVAACGSGGSEKKDAAVGPLEAAVHDAPALMACTPRAGSIVSVRPIGQVSGGAMLATSPPNDGRLFVVEQQGRIRIFENEQLLPTAFLDITELSGFVAGAEQGLLGLAFHPNYAFNRQFFVFYTRSNANVVARYTQSATNPNVADPNGEVILSIPDFAGNHNGGMIEFGPDGYLYIGTGDGGGGGDPCRNSQEVDRTTNTCQNPPRGTGLCPTSAATCEPLLGKILRIDVNTATGGKKYGIPTSNPYANGGGEPEIYVVGLRNPWRWSFDRMTGDMYIGDVGQEDYEEVTVLKSGQQAGANLGWSMYEADSCFGNYTCSATGKTMPQYSRAQSAGWASVIGGQVYRGSCFPDLQGYYFFTDYAARPLMRGKLETDGSLSVATLPTPSDWPTGPASIHADARGELFVTTTGGQVLQIEAGP